MISTANSAGLIADYPLPAPVPEIESLMQELVSAETSAESDMHDTACATLGHLASGGNRVRAGIGLAAGLRLGLSRNDSLIIGAAAELLHNASLVHDDLQDGAMVRGERPRFSPPSGRRLRFCLGIYCFRRLTRPSRSFRAPSWSRK